MHVMCRGKRGCVVALLHHSIDNDSAVYKRCERMATLHIKIQGLETGFSKEVHGNITSISRNNSSDAMVRRTRTKQFKFTDRSMHIFAAGTSAAVL
uniref:Elongator complex protein 6 n=1 Tax=Ciona savignyi TaxID=51511 RepID=H2ZC47_CIOSA